MMTLITDNLYVILIVGVCLIVLIYLLTYYIRTSIESEVAPLKKRVKKLQGILQEQDTSLFDDSDRTPDRSLGRLRYTQPASPGGSTPGGSTTSSPDDVDTIYPQNSGLPDSSDTSADGQLQDADSYFDPTKGIH